MTDQEALRLYKYAYSAAHRWKLPTASCEDIAQSMVEYRLAGDARKDSRLAGYLILNERRRMLGHVIRRDSRSTKVATWRRDIVRHREAIDLPFDEDFFERMDNDE